jgi:hypothetical protein
MTPLEKASEITLKYYNLGKHLYIPINFAQQCALIAVNEFMNYIRETHKHPYYKEDITEYTKEYWQEVKQEIQKL